MRKIKFDKNIEKIENLALIVLGGKSKEVVCYITDSLSFKELFSKITKIFNKYDLIITNKTSKSFKCNDKIVKFVGQKHFPFKGQAYDANVIDFDEERYHV